METSNADWMWISVNLPGAGVEDYHQPCYRFEYVCCGDDGPSDRHDCTSTIAEHVPSNQYEVLSIVPNGVQESTCSKSWHIRAQSASNALPSQAQNIVVTYTFNSEHGGYMP